MRTMEGYTVIVVRDPWHGFAHVVTDPIIAPGPSVPMARLMDLTLCLPDLADPCTVGGLLALVREAKGDPRAWVGPQNDTHHDEWWVVSTGDDRVFAGGISEAEALVAALEGAP